ncbi:hypothetical protein PPGU16_53680 [Paraburkholderia largidicola]|uniref:Uncharacterized protein n=1 Tax=Paraburkholderia largidicola TaxID=3014751 RepID=A0A7I8BVR7_9BURK|nr:hypothetical protein PPGU16_53680 [Paraburkholderia sp. PGU16]
MPIHGPPKGLTLHTATLWFALVANVLSLRITRFARPRYRMPRQTVHRRPGGKLCVGRSASHASLRTDSARVPPCKRATLNGATTYTQFATWAAHTICCRLPLCGCLKRVMRLFEALATSTGEGTAV